MIKTESIQKLETLLEQLRSLPLDAQSSEFKQWKRRADRYIEDIFKANERGQFSEFLDIEFEYIPSAYASYTDFDRTDDKKMFVEAREETNVLLKSFMEEVNEWNEKVMNDNNYVVEKIIDTKKVFIVHGHDDRLKEQVESFLLKQGLESIILHKQANIGKTIIEKLEHYGDVGYAIVLYTYCDDGKAKDATELNKRVRQNVVFEHGYFIGLLGRNKVSFLVDDNVEIPNDLSGAVYVAKSITWQYDLVKELKVAGYDVSADKVS